MGETTLPPEAAPLTGRLAREVIAAGAIAGIIGGLLMAIWGAFATAAKGLGFWAVPQMIGATFLRPEAMLHPLALTLWGTLLHLTVAAAWGVLFSSLVRRDTPPAACLLAGLGYGIAIFLLMVFVVVPVTNQVMADRASMMLGNLLIMHVLYGAGVSLAPQLRRRFADGSGDGDGNRHQGEHEEGEAHRADNLPTA